MSQKEKFGDYTVIRELGRGGTSVVLLVQDAHDRRYALKMLTTYTPTKANIAGLRRELAIYKRIAPHPFITNIFREEVIKDGPKEHICLLAEYCEGKNLKEYITEQVQKRKQLLPIEETIQIIWKVCRALEHAHTALVVHRDIKPHNILIGKRGKVQLTDFGISKVIDQNTIHGSADVKYMAGSVYYRSPEQLEAKEDHRSDIYSVGVILYELLTGSHPYGEETGRPLSIEFIKQKQVEPISKVNSKVPDRLAAIAEKAMAKNPKERFHSIKEMCHALEFIAQEMGIMLSDQPMISPRQAFFKTLRYWPLERINDLTTNLAANIVWFILIALLALILSVPLVDDSKLSTWLSGGILISFMILFAGVKAYSRIEESLSIKQGWVRLFDSLWRILKLFFTGIGSAIVAKPLWFITFALIACTFIILNLALSTFLVLVFAVGGVALFIFSIILFLTALYQATDLRFLENSLLLFVFSVTFSLSLITLQSEKVRLTFDTIVGITFPISSEPASVTDNSSPNSSIVVNWPDFADRTQTASLVFWFFVVTFGLAGLFSSDQPIVGLILGLIGGGIVGTLAGSIIDVATQFGDNLSRIFQ